MHPTALDDQLIAAANETENVFCAHAQANEHSALDGHPAESMLIYRLASLLHHRGRSALCEHLQGGPGVATWQPGAQIVVCPQCTSATPETTLCSTLECPGEPSSTMGVLAGHIVILAPLCQSCLGAPSGAEEIRVATELATKMLAVALQELW